MTATPRPRGRRPVPIAPIPVKTVLVAALAAVISAFGLLPGVASATPARTAGPAAAAPSGASSLWPANPDWQRYVPAPASRDVHPVSVMSTSGQVTGADALTHPGHGGSATLTRTAADTGSTDIVLDYGKNVGGLPEFTVKAETGSPTLLAGYSEARQFLTPNGDGGTPFGSGDPSRSDSYTVSGPGTIVNRFVQGGERYQEISLTSPGSVTLSSVEIYYEPYLGTPDTYKGYFVSSSDQLNRIWYDGAYTVNMVQMRPGTPGGYWQIAGGQLSADGGGVGQLTTGASWTDYTVSFKAMIVSNQAGWVVRSQNPSSNYLLILNADNDTAGTPNVLQELVQNNGSYYTAGDVKLPIDIKPGTPYDVSTTVSGATVTTSINGQQVASFSTSGLPSGVSAYSSGTVGFREFSGENANFSDLVVTSPTGATLYQNPLSFSSDLSAFAVPGVNTLPLILDGAKRDRAVWEGDLSVSGPALLYSSGATAYLKDSLELLGSYQLQSGFVEGVQTPSTPVNTSGLLPGTVGSYSATYSMYFVTNLADYYRYTGDQAFVRKEWPIVQRELAWNASQLNAQGLFVTDSSDGSTWNLENLTGAETDVNALYYQTLTDGAVLASAAGQTSAAAGYRTGAAALRTAINANLWDPALGAYDASTSSRGFVSEDANVLPVLFGVASSRDVPTILATVRSALATPFGAQRVSTPVPSGYNQDISPFMGSSQLWADFTGNDTADAMTLLRDEWGYMAANDPGSTDWERFQPDGTVNGGGTSWAHGWSTGSTTALSQDVLGVSPVSPGYRTWLVQPHPGTLSWAEGQAPTPQGPLTVDWGHRSSDGEFAMHVSSPAGTSGDIAVPTFGRPVSIQVNGHPAWDGQRATASGVRADGEYIVLSGLPGGRYDIVTHSAGPVSRSLTVTPQRGPVPAVGGTSSPITVTVTGRAPATLNGQVTVSVPAGWTASPASFAVNGSEGPVSEVVTVHVTPPSGVSGGPVPLTVTASAGGLTAHAQVSVLPYGHWPSGATATASSYHAPNTVNGQVRTYVPGNAIDGDLSTFWNDANPATYPAVLTVTSPASVTLNGIAFGSSADGVPMDFTVATWNGSAWVQQAVVTGNSQVYRWIPFAAPASTTQVQITVTKDQPAYAGEFTRVSELDP